MGDGVVYTAGQTVYEHLLTTVNLRAVAAEAKARRASEIFDIAAKKRARQFYDENKCVGEEGNEENRKEYAAGEGKAGNQRR